MRVAKPLSIASLLAAMALALAGCGGGDDDSTTTAAPPTETTTALSKAELISEGDAICAEVNAAVGSADSTGAEVDEQIIQVSELYVGMVESIKQLGAPDDPAGYAEFIAAAEDLAKVEGEAKLATEREDVTAIGEAATAAAPALEEFESEAERYGFSDCSEGPNAPTPSAATAAEATEAPAEVEEEGGVEAAPEEVEEPEVEEVAPEEVAPETGGAGGGVEEAAPETGGGSGGGSSGGVGPG
jgi:hypothetical protein